MSSILDILNSPWAILPDRLEEIQAIYAARISGETPDLAAIEARIGRPLDNPPQGYEVRDGAALVPLRGVMGQRMNLMSAMSGGTSTELFARDIRMALEDPAVESIVIMADTPGGSVAGTQAAAAAVMAARGVKPLATFVEGMMASAGVWVGTAADAVILDSGTSQAGSIGVVATHVDVSKREEMMGVRTTEIVAGRFKRAASQYGALTETGRQVMQDQVDYLYSQFVADVARHRGVSAEQVLADMADGRMFIGQQAINAGLADGIATLDETIAELNNRAQSSRRVLISAPSSMESPTMTPQQAAHEWAAENPEAAALIRAEGADGERQRIASVRSATLAGHEQLIERLAMDGHTTGGEAALAVLAAEREQQKAQATARFADAPQPLEAAVIPDDRLEAQEKKPAEVNPHALAQEAQKLVAAAAAQGRTLSFSDAVAQAQRTLTPA
jgi:signal peptide peptidase SppA